MWAEEDDGQRDWFPVAEDACFCIYAFLLTWVSPSYQNAKDFERIKSFVNANLLSTMHRLNMDFSGWNLMMI